MKKKQDAFQAAHFPNIPHQQIDLEMHPVELSWKKSGKPRVETESLGQVVAMDTWKDNTMQEIILSAKDLIRENILQSFQHVQAICKLAETERDKTYADKQFLRVVAADDKRLYPPSTQASATKGPGGRSESFIKFQELVSQLVDRSFVQSGLSTRSLQLEKQNTTLYQMASDENQHANNNNFREVSPLLLADWPSYEGQPDQQAMLRSPKFKSNFEHIKVQILKRIKKNMETYLENNVHSNESPQKMMSGMDADTSDLQSNLDFKFTPEALIGENDFFKQVQVQVIETLIQQRAVIEEFYKDKVAKTLHLNYELRKSFLKELQLLRETYFQESHQKIDRETALNYSRVHLFRFEEGLDPHVCELLNEKIKLVSQQFLTEIQQQKAMVEHQRSTIQKYVALTPKTFKLVQLTLEEVFEALAKIHQDSFAIWKHLTAAYPQDYFVGVIEAEFGAFFDAESEARLKQEVIDINNSLQGQVDRMAVAFQREKMKIYEAIDEKDVLLDKLREEHRSQIEFHEEVYQESMKSKIRYEQAKLKATSESEQMELLEKLNRTKKKYKELKKMHVSNETKLSFFKWKLIVQAFRQKGDRAQIDIAALKRVLSDDQMMKVDNSVAQKEEKYQLYKYLFEETKREQADLQVRYNDILGENAVLSGKVDILKNDYHTLQDYAYKNLFPKLKEVESENITLKANVKSCLKLVAKTDTQKTLIEEKFNIKQHKADIDPKHRVVVRLLNEFQIETESARVIMQAKLERAAAMRPGATSYEDSNLLGSDGRLAEDPRRSTNPDEAVSTDGREYKPTVQCSHSLTQTDIQNTDFALRLVNERPDRQREDALDPKFDQETQTQVDYRKWRKLEEYRSICENGQSRMGTVSNTVVKKTSTTNRRMTRFGTAATLQLQGGNSRNSEGGSASGSFRRASERPAQMAALGALKSGSLKNVVARAAEKFKKGTKVVKKDSSKKEPAEGTASSGSLSDGPKRQIPEGIDEDVNELADSSNSLSSLTPDKTPLAGQPSKPFGESPDPTDDMDGGEDSKIKDNDHEALVTYESLPEAAAPTIAAIRQREEEYDRLRSLFELNIDIVDVVKRSHPSIYQEVLADLRDEDQRNILESNRLLDSSKRWLKKLYKSQHRIRLTEMHTKQQEQKQSSAQLEREALIFLKNLPILKNCIMKAVNSRNKMQQKQAHTQLIKQLSKIKSEGIDIDRIPVSYETPTNVLSASMGKSIGISPRKRNIVQNKMLSLNENAYLEKGMAKQQMQKTVSPHVNGKLNWRQMQRLQPQKLALPFAQMASPPVESKATSTYRQSMKPKLPNDDITTQLAEYPERRREPAIMPAAAMLIASGSVSGGPSLQGTFRESANKAGYEENKQAAQSARAPQEAAIYQQIWQDPTATNSPSADPDVPQNNQATAQESNLKTEGKDGEGEHANGVESHRPSAPNSGGSQPGRQVVLSREGQADEQNTLLNHTHQSQDIVDALERGALLGAAVKEQFSSLTPQSETIEHVVQRERQPGKDNSQEYDLIQQQFQQFEQLNRLAEGAPMDSTAPISFQTIDEIMKKEPPSRTPSTVPRETEIHEYATKPGKVQLKRKMRPLTTRVSKHVRAINSGGIHVKGKKIAKAYEGDGSSIPNAMLTSHDSNAMLLKDYLSQETDKNLRGSIPELFKQITQSGSTHFEAVKVKQGSDAVNNTDSAVNMRQSFNSTFVFDNHPSVASPNSQRVHQQFRGGGQFGAAKPQFKVAVSNQQSGMLREYIDSDAHNKRERLQEFFHNKKKMRSKLQQSPAGNTRLKSARVGKSALNNSQIRFNAVNAGTAKLSRLQSGRSNPSSYRRVVTHAAQQLFSPRTGNQTIQGAPISTNYQTVDTPVESPLLGARQATEMPGDKFNMNIISAESRCTSPGATLQAGKARILAGSVMNPQYIASKTGEPKMMNRTMVGDAQSVIHRVPNLRMPIYK